MKKRICHIAAVIAALLICGSNAAAQPRPDRVISLYPQGQEAGKGIVENGREVTLGAGESNGLTGPEGGTPGRRITGVGDNARLEIYLPERNTAGQMLIMCPGGGYSCLSTGLEGSWAAEWFLKEGIAVCVVIYRMPNGHGSVPLTDVQNAFRYCRAHAGEWGVKQIGVMGYSAGGHLAACASTLFTDEITRPDFTILAYPVITMKDGLTHEGTRRELTGKDAAKYDLYSAEKLVRDDTPPTLLILSADDGAVPPENSFLYFNALAAHDIRREIHVLPAGGHGWGFATAKYAKDGKDPLGDYYRAVFFDILDNYLYNMSLMSSE